MEILSADHLQSEVASFTELDRNVFHNDPVPNNAVPHVSSQGAKPFVNNDLLHSSSSLKMESAKCRDSGAQILPEYVIQLAVSAPSLMVPAKSTPSVAQNVEAINLNHLHSQVVNTSLPSKNKQLQNWYIPPTCVSTETTNQNSNSLSKVMNNNSIFPWSFQATYEQQNTMVSKPLQTLPQNNQFIKVEAATATCSTTHGTSMLSQPLIETINDSLSSIPRNSSLANALNDFDKTYEQVKRKNEESDRLHVEKIPKLSSDSALSISDLDPLHLAPTSSFRALLGDDSNDASASTSFPSMDPELYSQGIHFTVRSEPDPPVSTQLNSFLASSPHHPPSTSSTANPSSAPQSSGITNTVVLDHDIDTLLGDIGTLHNEGPSQHWSIGNSSLLSNTTAQPSSSKDALLHQLLSTTSHNSEKVQDDVKPSFGLNADGISSTICPVCKKAITGSSETSTGSQAQMCKSCVSAIEKNVKPETTESTNTSKQEIPIKKEDSKPNSSASVVAHLVAVNSNPGSNSALPSTVPLYVLIDGKAIPLTVAQVQTSAESNENNAAARSSATSTSQNQVSVCNITTAPAAVSKNMLKISPMPMPSKSSGCLMIAGIVPGSATYSQTAEKQSKPANDDALRIYGCDYPNCNKRYFKSSHLKAHIR